MKLVLFFFLINFSVFALVEKTLHVEGQFSQNNSWSEFSSSEELNFKKLFELLNRSPTGERLLLKAQEKASASGLTLLDVIKMGNSSLTDTTLIRKFNPEYPDQVVYESKSVVFLNKELRWDDALLDLAHELTHFIYREDFNPYGENFNAEDFIKGTIEGSGGEVWAFINECKVLRELFGRKFQMRSHCQKIEDFQGNLSFKQAVKLFYHIGNYHSKFDKTLKQRGLENIAQKVSSDKTNFVSSAYGVPYPVAALMEYDLVLDKVCENDRKRLAYMQQGPERAPAGQKSKISSFTKIYASRCSQLE